MKKLFFIVVMLSLAVSVQAAYLEWGTEVVGLTWANNHGGDTNMYIALNTINGNGLNGLGPNGLGHSTVQQYNSWLCNVGLGTLSPTGNSTVWVQYELDAVRTIADLRVWGLNQPGGWIASIKDAEISVSTDASIWTSVYVGTLGPGTGLGDYEGAVYDIPDTAAKYICIEGYNTWDNMEYYGLAEVAINEVPEPATIALLGLGALALLRKRS
jgi:hypothetical protein